MAFTELGIAMISGVLNNSRAIQVNIQIIRIFTRIRQLVLDNAELRLEIEGIRYWLNNQDKNMEIVFQYLDELCSRIPQTTELAWRNRIGYKPDTE